MRVLLLFVLLAACAGCQQQQHVVPYKGKVIYQNQPLTSGSVMFQPEGGIPARGVIQADGTFELTTYKPGDGATVGKNKVRIVSTAAVGGDPTQGELQTGASTIPPEYNDLSTTPLTVDVAEPGETAAVLEIK